MLIDPCSNVECPYRRQKSNAFSYIIEHDEIGVIRESILQSCRRNEFDSTRLVIPDMEPIQKENLYAC